MINPMNPSNRSITINPAAWSRNEKYSTQKGRTQNQDPTSFAAVLKKEFIEKESVKFSKHAEQRMITRNITLSQDQLQKVNQAVEKARGKGVKESLIVMKDVALIVNIPGNTVVTAVDGTSMKDNIFTNIDGAVII